MGWLGGAASVVGGIAGLFGGGMSPEEKAANRNLMDQMRRSNQFWQQAQEQQGSAQKYFSPIAGGSRQAAMESMAPEIQGATQRMDMGRRSLLNLSSRSGGAGAMMDPYAKAATATTMMEKARPGAAAAMGQMAGQTGGWAQNQSGSAGQMLSGAQERSKQEAERGKGVFNAFTGGFKQLGDWWGGRDK